MKVDSLPKPSIFFLCTGNSARSQMAEAFLRKHGADRFDAYSAGLNPVGLNPLTIQVMQEAGIDLSGQRSKGFKQYVGKMPIQYLITLCDDAERNCPAGMPGVTRGCIGPSKIRPPLRVRTKRRLQCSVRSATRLKRES